jgi:hypothetical protein
MLHATFVWHGFIIPLPAAMKNAMVLKSVYVAVPHTSGVS